jgi:hypothetical protein
VTSAVPARPASTTGRVKADPRGSIPERLAYLFQEVHPPGRKPYSPREVAQGINERGDSISEIYLQKILVGERGGAAHPEKLKSIAGFFGETLDYFYREDGPDPDTQRLIEIITLRNDTIRAISLLTAKLSEPAQRAILDVVRASAIAQGIDPDS